MRFFERRQRTHPLQRKDRRVRNPTPPRLRESTPATTTTDEAKTPYHGVGVHGLLLDVADEAVASLGADEVRQEEGVVHDPLGDHHRETEDGAGLLELEEGQQVHPLVLGLLQQRVDPPVVPASHIFRCEVPAAPTVVKPDQ